MKRTYVIVPRKIDSKPPLTLSCGFAMAQIHHATAKAAKRFDINPDEIAIVLEVPDGRALFELSDELFLKGIRFIEYWEESHLFEGKELTALVTEPSDVLESLSQVGLWTCECNKEFASVTQLAE